MVLNLSRPENPHMHKHSTHKTAHLRVESIDLPGWSIKSTKHATIPTSNFSNLTYLFLVRSLILSTLSDMIIEGLSLEHRTDNNNKINQFLRISLHIIPTIVSIQRFFSIDPLWLFSSLLFAFHQQFDESSKSFSPLCVCVILCCCCGCFYFDCFQFELIQKREQQEFEKKKVSFKAVVGRSVGGGGE